MRMRVALARALVGEAEVLLLDEPFAALDEITRFASTTISRRWRRGGGLSILFVTHSVYEAVGLSDRIAVMSTAGGRIEREIAVTAPEGRGGGLSRHDGLRRAGGGGVAGAGRGGGRERGRTHRRAA